MAPKGKRRTDSAPATPVLDRTPPSNIEAERAVLGAVLLDPAALSTALEVVSQDDFFREAHQHIFEAMCRLFEASKEIDILTVSDALSSSGELERAGGAAYLAGLLEAVPATTAVDHYAQIVHERGLTRRMIYAAAQILETGYAGGTPSRDFLDFAERTVFEVLDKNQRREAIPIREALRVALERVQSLYERSEGLTGITTGFEKFDNITNGLQPSDLIILAGRPGMGKTTFAMNVACNAALHGNAAVVVFSLEMGADQLVLRLLSSEARVELSKLRSGRLDDRDWDDVANAAGRLAEAKVFIDETPAISALEVRSRARRLKLEDKCDLIVIDYLQLMGTSRNISSREQQISEISRTLKELAREIHVPVIALSQLNRGLEGRTDKRPMMSDLRESGAIEQDADLIVFVYRDEIYNAETPDKGIAEIIIGKHRNGPTGSVRVKFFNSFTRFDNLYEDEAPSGF